MVFPRFTRAALILAAATCASASQDALEQLNSAFRQAYVQAKADALARSGAVLLVSGDRLLLFRHDVQVDEAVIRPALYHRLKEVAHGPLALFLVLEAPGEPGDGERLRGLRALVQGAREGLKEWCPPADQPRQERILDACLGLLDQGLGPGRPSPDQLAASIRALEPALRANLDQAAALELEALDRAVARFRKGMAPGEWPGAQVVISTSHMAREDEISFQYFARLLGEPREGGRIVVGEGLWEPKDALDLLATHRVDGTLGLAVFGDAGRMHRDVLADGARAWLDQRLPVR